MPPQMPAAEAAPVSQLPAEAPPQMPAAGAPQLLAEAPPQLQAAPELTLLERRSKVLKEWEFWAALIEADAGAEVRSCFSIQPAYAADILTPGAEPGTCLKSQELRKDRVSARQEVFIVPTGSGNVACGIIDMEDSVETGIADMLTPEAVAKHRVSQEELNAYLGDRSTLHVIPVSNPRVFRDPVKLDDVKGFQKFRNVSQAELARLRAAPLATPEERLHILSQLRLREASLAPKASRSSASSSKRKRAPSRSRSPVPAAETAGASSSSASPALAAGKAKARRAKKAK